MRILYGIRAKRKESCSMSALRLSVLLLVAGLLLLHGLSPVLG